MKISNLSKVFGIGLVSLNLAIVPSDITLAREVSTAESTGIEQKNLNETEDTSLTQDALKESIETARKGTWQTLLAARDTTKNTSGTIDTAQTTDKQLRQTRVEEVNESPDWGWLGLLGLLGLFGLSGKKKRVEAVERYPVTERERL